MLLIIACSGVSWRWNKLSGQLLFIILLDLAQKLPSFLSHSRSVTSPWKSWVWPLLSLLYTPPGVNVFDCIKTWPLIGLCSLYHMLLFYPVGNRAVSTTDSEATGQNALWHTFGSIWGCALSEEASALLCWGDQAALTAQFPPICRGPLDVPKVSDHLFRLIDILWKIRCPCTRPQASSLPPLQAISSLLVMSPMTVLSLANMMRWLLWYLVRQAWVSIAWSRKTRSPDEGFWFFAWLTEDLWWIRY